MVGAQVVGGTPARGAADLAAMVVGSEQDQPRLGVIASRQSLGMPMIRSLLGYPDINLFVIGLFVPPLGLTAAWRNQ